MTNKRSLIITEETYEVIISRRAAGRAARAWCDGCAAEVEMITPERAALLAAANTRAIYRWVEAALLHFAETPEGSLTLCQNSLAELLAAPRPRLTARELRP